MLKIDCIDEDLRVFHVVSEPGDMTRYDYIVAALGPDEFVFMPYENTFPYPQRLYYWEVKGIADDVLIEKAKSFGVNPWTLKECIRIIKKIRSELWGIVEDETT